MRSYIASAGIPHSRAADSTHEAINIALHSSMLGEYLYFISICIICALFLETDSREKTNPTNNPKPTTTHQGSLWFSSSEREKGNQTQNQKKHNQTTYIIRRKKERKRARNTLDVLPAFPFSSRPYHVRDHRPGRRGQEMWWTKAYESI